MLRPKKFLLGFRRFQPIGKKISFSTLLYNYALNLSKGKDLVSKTALTISGLAAGRPGYDIDSVPVGANELVKDDDGLVLYGGYLSRLTYAEDFTNAVWSTVYASGDGVLTLTPGQLDPIGGNTAVRVQLTMTTGYAGFVHDRTSTSPYKNHAISGYIKNNGGTTSLVFNASRNITLNPITITDDWTQYEYVTESLVVNGGYYSILTSANADFFLWHPSYTGEAVRPYLLPYIEVEGSVVAVPENNSGTSRIIGPEYATHSQLVDALDGVADGTIENSGNLVSENKYEIVTTETDHFGSGVVAGDRVTGLTTALDANNTAKQLSAAQGRLSLTWIPKFDDGDLDELGDDLLDSWDFTSGWTAVSATIDDLNSFTTAGDGGVKTTADLLTVGKGYKIIFARTTTASASDVYNDDGDASNQLGTGDGTFTFIASNANLYVHNTGAGTTDVTSFTIEEILVHNILSANDEERDLLFYEPYTDTLKSTDGTNVAEVACNPVNGTGIDIVLDYDETNGMRLEYDELDDDGEIVSTETGDIVAFAGRFPYDVDGHLQFGLNADAPQVFKEDSDGNILKIYKESNLWTPAELFQDSEAGAWYDPSDLSTLFTDAAGTTAVTSDGDPVGKMADKSGNGNHMTQSISASRPTYKTDGTYHWLEFDGVDDYLEYGSTNFGGSTAYHAYGYDTNGQTYCLLMSIYNLGSPYVWVFQENSVSTSVSYLDGILSNLWVDSTLKSISTRGDLYTAINGKKVSVFEAAWTATEYNFNIGYYDGGALDGLSGKLYSHIWRDQLSNDERGQLETYIATKSGVTL